jgi:very-short-patch-repair endonuclease
MNPFLTLRDVQGAYQRYVSTFQRFQHPAIRAWVAEHVATGRILWREPFLSLGRRFARGETFAELVADPAVRLHPDTWRCFTVSPTPAGWKTGGTPHPEPLHPHRHQSDAVRVILGERANTVVATGTGSGKSYTFGIPIVSECLHLRDQGVPGIKAVIIYPMNALANSQYDDLSRRLAGSGLRIALYTGETEYEAATALDAYTQATGRAQPYDSEVLSRVGIQQRPPDILMTNYQMLEFILTRFEDQVLFPAEHAGALRFLVLDELHTYTGKRGADVACLIRRLKQHTGTIGKLRCIGTSATVQSGPAEDTRALIARFASDLFGEPFTPEHVLGEQYIDPEGTGNSILPASITVTEEMLAAFDGTSGKLMAQAVPLAEALLGRRLLPAEGTREGLGIALAEQATLYFLDHELNIPAGAPGLQGNGPAAYPISLEAAVERYQAAYRAGHDHDACRRELLAALLVGQVATMPLYERQEPRLIPRLHAFFSQGRTIHACLAPDGPHLNERGDLLCPECAAQQRQTQTFPLCFCRGCGQEYYGVALQEDSMLLPRDLDTLDVGGAPLYLAPIVYDAEQMPLPDNWRTPKGAIQKKYQAVLPAPASYCPVHNRLNGACGCQEQRRVTVVPAPFLFCPSCGITYDGRSREFSKLFSFGLVGRSTATDVIVGETLRALPADERKIIAFSDNRQDTALQAAHMNNLQRRLHFRRGLVAALEAAGCVIAEDGSQQDADALALGLEDVGQHIFQALKANDALPTYSRSQGKYSTSRADDGRYQRYLRFGVLQELESTRRRNHLNLEDTGLLVVRYDGLEAFAADADVWADIPALARLPAGVRAEYLQGFLDVMRRRRAIAHDDLLNFEAFDLDVLGRLNAGVFFHQGGYGGSAPVGYSDDAATSSRAATVYRWASPNGALLAWTRRALALSREEGAEVIRAVVDALRHPDAGFLRDTFFKNVGTLTMLAPERLTLQLSRATTHPFCPKCGLVYHYRLLNVCSGPTCNDLRPTSFASNYFRLEYLRPLAGDVRVEAEEHSAQVSGRERRQIETRFRDSQDNLNTLICTPTMELGVDIGQLTSVYMRNVPPSPSNYAQRAGRAGRKGQSSLITVFCGIGSARGPHDQYFYQHPEKIIAGAIAVPRFLLENRALLRSHIHSLVLETLGRQFKLPAHPRELLNLQAAGFPLFANLEQQLRSGLQEHSTATFRAVCHAFAQERSAFPWFTETFIRDTIEGFVDNLSAAFDPWRAEYQRLLDEFDEIAQELRNEGTSGERERRQKVVSERLEDMREGRRGFYTYSYLGAQGFLPNYAFPRQATTVSFYESKDEISRERTLALREYAPGNSIYYRGNRYEVIIARSRTSKGTPAFTDLLICPQCKAAYLGVNAKLPACETCGASLLTTHLNPHALALTDMLAKRRTSITADEEERTRLGYRISYHYQMGKRARHAAISSQTGNEPLLKLTYEHNGKLVLVNDGLVQAERDRQKPGFVLCTKCNRWLIGEERIERHLSAQHDQACRHGATRDDLAHQVVLYSDSSVDVVTLDVPPPEGLAPADVVSFYHSLGMAFLHATTISLDLDESELNGFLAPHPHEPERLRIILYETAEGGAGAVEALSNPNRLRQVAARACELLHEPMDSDEPALDAGCERACYDCLLSFYNQVHHYLMNRHLALPFLRQLCQPLVSTPLAVSAGAGQAGASLEALLARCQSDLERAVLRAIYLGGLPLPDDAQHLCADSSGAPIASADFYYAEQRLAVLVDGPAHQQDYAQASDAERRTRLKSAGYSVLPIAHDALVAGLRKLAERLNASLKTAQQAMPAAVLLPEERQPSGEGWDPWLYDMSASVLHPLMRALASNGCPPPTEVGRDLPLDGRVIALVELCWSRQQVAVALPGQVSPAAYEKLEAAGWQIITANVEQLDQSVNEARQALTAGARNG